MADQSGKHLPSMFLTGSSNFRSSSVRISPLGIRPAASQAGPSTSATARSGSVGRPTLPSAVPSTTPSLHPRAPGAIPRAPAPPPPPMSALLTKSVADMMAEMEATGTRLPAATGSLKPTLNPRAFLQIPRPLPRPQLAPGSSPRATFRPEVIRIPGGRDMKKGLVVLDATQVAAPSPTKRRLDKARVAGETEGTLVPLGDFESGVFRQFEDEDEDEEEAANLPRDKAAERRVHFERTSAKEDAAAALEVGDSLANWFVDADLPEVLYEDSAAAFSSSTPDADVDVARQKLEGTSTSSQACAAELKLEEELKTDPLYGAEDAFGSRPVAFGTMTLKSSAAQADRESMMDTGEMKWFDVMSFPSTIPVLVPDDSAEASSASGGGPPMRYANSLWEIPNRTLMGHVRVYKKTRLGNEQETEEDRESARVAAQFGYNLENYAKTEAQASDLSLQKWQKKYRIVAKFDFAGADAEALKVGSGSSASGGNAAASSHKISYNVGIQPTSCLEEIAFVPMSSEEQAEIRLTQDLLMAQNLSKLEALLRPPPPPSASSTSSSSAAPSSLQPAFGAAPAAAEGAAASNATRGPRDMMILGRVRNHMTVYATLQPHPADLLPTSSAAGPSGGLAPSENAADAEDVPSTMPKLPSRRARRRHRRYQREKDAAAAAANAAQPLADGNEAADGATGETKSDEDVDMAEK